jgi:hypothetical protein
VTNVDDIAAMVAAATEQARELTGQIARTRAAVGELAAKLAVAGVDESSLQAHRLGEDTETLASDAAGIAESLQQVRGHVEVLCDRLAEGGGSRLSPPALPAAPTGGRVERFDPQQYFNEMPVMKPKRDLEFGKVQDRTHGRWPGAIEAGPEEREWISGEDDRFARIAQERWEREPPGPKPTKVFSVAGHVEVKFAEYMREKGLTRELIVINNPDGPCPLPMGCDRYMSWVLELGSSLTVVYPGGARTFVGTGSIA